ncbi:MAG: MerR family transcriptional regulator [Chloroflexi bacterium]|nr:MAG: MerR family transcriptional regulator [Chloroflexota bacterium]
MKRKDDASVAVTLPSPRDPSIHLDKPIYTLSVASEILATHPRTLMMYEHLNMIKPKRTVTNRRRYSQRDLMKLQAIHLKQLQLAGLKPPDALKDLDVTLLDV